VKRVLSRVKKEKAKKEKAATLQFFSSKQLNVVAAANLEAHHGNLRKIKLFIFTYTDKGRS